MRAKCTPAACPPAGGGGRASRHRPGGDREGPLRLGAAQRHGRREHDRGRDRRSQAGAPARQQSASTSPRTRSATARTSGSRVREGREGPPLRQRAASAPSSRFRPARRSGVSRARLRREELRGLEEGAHRHQQAGRHRELVAQAVAAGKLSPEQGLVYRAFAAFDDHRLPAAYAGDDAAHEDSIMREVAESWPKLSTAQRKQVEPFFIPPAAKGGGLGERRPRDRRRHGRPARPAGTPPAAGSRPPEGRSRAIWWRAATGAGSPRGPARC